METAKAATVRERENSSINKRSATISHDLNQPLNSIKMISGGIVYLLEQGKRLPDEELAECMKEISCQTNKIASLIKKMQME